MLWVPATPRLNYFWMLALRSVSFEYLGFVRCNVLVFFGGLCLLSFQNKHMHAYLLSWEIFVFCKRTSKTKQLTILVENIFIMLKRHYTLVFYISAALGS